MIDIFIKSCAKDFKWLEYCLKSISKNVTGFGKVVLLIPIEDLAKYSEMVLPINVIVDLHLTNEYGNRYLFQQWCKMSAYKFTDAKYIMFVDSDCIFPKEVDLIDLVKDNKPEILYTHYSKVGDAICWKQCTDRFMNEDVEFEFMRRNGLIYHRNSLEKIHSLELNLESIIMNSAQFSEFNAIGAWCFKHEQGKYSFVNTDLGTFGNATVWQGWTWGDVNYNKNQEREIKKMLE
tara:strand:+ start:247 stop:948 length:702 start_codon:yes stop_codon:yes gene_type:complete